MCVRPLSYLRVFVTRRTAALRTRYNLSVVFFGVVHAIATKAWTSVATALSSSEQRRSCRNWFKHLALTAAACLSIDMSKVSNTPSTRTTLDAAYVVAGKCELKTPVATRNLKQIVLRPWPHQLCLGCIQFNPVCCHPLRKRLNTLFNFVRWRLLWHAMNIESSANTWSVISYWAAMSANSAVYKIKSSGPRTEPCGTEHMMWMILDESPSTTTQ